MIVPPLSIIPAGSWTLLDVLNHLWQSTAAGLAVLGLLLAGAAWSARTRRALGLMALAKFALPMALFTGLLMRFGGAPERWLEPPALTLPVDLPMRLAVPTATVVSRAVVPSAGLPVGTLVVAAWLAGFAVAFGWWLVRGACLRRRMLAAARPVSPEMERRLASAAARVGFRHPPRCAMVEDTHDAGVLGIFRPVVILPEGLEATLTPAELEAVLLHECIHVQRRDNLWGAAQQLLASLFWFHPLVWVLHRRIGLESEKSCDERVLALTGAPEVYAAGIVKCVRHALGVAQPSLAGVTTPPIVARIQNILAHGTRRHRPLAHGAALVAGVALLALSGKAGSFANRALAAAEPPQPAAAPAVSEAGARALPPSPAAIVAGEVRPVPRYQYNQRTGGFEVSGFEYVKTVSVDFVDEDVRNIVRSVADAFEVNCIMPRDLQAKASLKAANQTWREIFQAVLTPAGYSFVLDGNIVKIVPLDLQPPETGGQPAQNQTASASPGQNTRAKKDTFSVDFPDEDIRRVIQRIADLFGLRVVMPDTLQGRTSLKLRDVTWRQVFQAVLDPVGHTFVEEGDTVKIIRVAIGQGSSGTDEVLRAAADVRTVIETRIENGTRDKATLSVEFVDEDVRTILRSVADVFALNIIMPDALKVRVTVRVRDATWQQIFQTALDPIGYTYVQADRIIKIVTKESLNEPVTTEVFLLNHAKAADILPTIASLIEPAVGKIQVDARTNALVITERSARLARIRPIIERLDRATDSVTLSTNTAAGDTTISGGAPAANTSAAQYHQAELNYLYAEAARLKREAEAARQALDANKAATAGVSDERARALQREAEATAANYETIQAHVQAAEAAAKATADTARFAALTAERDAAKARQHAPAATVNPPNLDSTRVPAEAPKPANQQSLPPGAGASLAPASSLPTTAELAKALTTKSGTTSFRGMQVYDVSRLDQRPVPKYQARPLFPRELREQGIAGDVLVDFIVDTDGDVQNAYAVKSSRREFEESAVQAVKKWKFRPGRKDGKDVNTHLQVPFVFALDEK